MQLLQPCACATPCPLVETFLLSVVNFQTLIATKAARIVEAAEGRPVVDFGTRRAHGPEAGELAARAALVDFTRQVTLAEVESHVVRYTGGLGHPLAAVLRFLRGGSFYMPPPGAAGGTGLVLRLPAGLFGGG